LASRDHPCYGILEMPIKPVITGTTRAARVGCVWRGLGFSVCPAYLKYGRMSEMSTD